MGEFGCRNFENLSLFHMTFGANVGRSLFHGNFRRVKSLEHLLSGKENEISCVLMFPIRSLKNQVEVNFSSSVCTHLS